MTASRRVRLALVLTILASCTMDIPNRTRGRNGPNLERSAPSTSAANPAGGRLGARPHGPALPAPGPGLHQLGMEGGRDGLLYVPAGYRPGVPAPLVLMLHGAGGNARGGIDPLRRFADEAGILLVAPDSRASTWDVIIDRYGPDVAFIDRTLAHVFDRFLVDPDRLAAGGFSDGASYALSIALTNGDLFTSVIAFSPGFSAPGQRRGSPRVFLSHGTGDRVLQIDRTSRRIHPMLERRGYEVRYEEFAGGHLVPPEIAGLAVEWFLKGSPG